MPVPPVEEWEGFLQHIRAFLRHTPLVPPLTLDELGSATDALLESAALPLRYRDFLLVQLHNCLWTPVVASIPFQRRILMLPPCLRSSTLCPATFDAYGLLCAHCGRCGISGLSRQAEALGYAVLVVESVSLVQPFLDKGDADAVVGVGCMAALERSFHPMVQGAIPGLAIPLLRDGCRDTGVSLAHVEELLRSRTDGQGVFPDYHALKVTVDGWFAPDAIRALPPRPPNAIENAGLEWLGLSGKRWRPFLTAATYAALTGCPPDRLPESLRRAALAVECLHKSSLIFDDIQDDDALRYDRPTLHRQHGVPLAMTAGLYLLGLGYHLIATCGAPADEVAAMLTLTGDAHLQLCGGQGAELWSVRHPRLLAPSEVLDIFRRKTSPAFSVGLRMGAVLAGARHLDALLQAFGDALGTAYQIQDDLVDSRSGAADDDISAGRPSFVLALAGAHAPPSLRAAMETALRERQAGYVKVLRTAIADTNSRALAVREMSAYRQSAIRALQPLGNSHLKILLHRFLSQAVPPDFHP